jgi:hypothetical protein
MKLSRTTRQIISFPAIIIVLLLAAIGTIGGVIGISGALVLQGSKVTLEGLVDALRRFVSRGAS